MEKIDETGNRHERLTVVAESKSQGGKVMWLCKCDCGNTVTIRGTSLRSGRTESCGCITKKDEIGNRHERLVVIAEAEPLSGRVAWLCKCDCGNEKVILGASLRAGHTGSCGCLHKEVSSAKRGDKTPRMFTDQIAGGIQKSRKNFMIIFVNAITTFVRSAARRRTSI